MQTPSMTHDRLTQLTHQHPSIVRIGRAGWLAKGIVYLLAGVLALFVVTRSFGWVTPAGNKEASPTGAIKAVAQSTGGPVLLLALAAGMFLYAAWRLITAVLPGSSNAEGVATRIGYVLSAIMYTTFGATAMALARSRTATADGNKTVSDITVRVLQHTAGRWVVGIAGAVLIGAGIYRCALGVKFDVTDDIDMSAMSGTRRRLIRRLGAAGEVGRGIAMGLIGFFLIRAAATVRSTEATGLDGALRRLAIQPWGVFAVAVVGLGLVSYGLFCVGTFTRRQLQGP